MLWLMYVWVVLLGLVVPLRGLGIRVEMTVGDIQKANHPLAYQSKVYDWILKSIHIAKLMRHFEKLPDCSEHPTKKAAMCLLKNCGLCQKFRQKGDWIKRYACPQPLEMVIDTNNVPTAVYFEADDDGYIKVCKVTYGSLGGCSDILGSMSLKLDTGIFRRGLCDL